MKPTDGIISREQWSSSKVPKLDTLLPPAVLWNPIHENYKQNDWQGTTLMEAITHWEHVWLFTKNTNATLITIVRKQWFVAKTKIPYSPVTPPIRLHKRHGCKLFPSPQKQCRLYVEVPMTLFFLVPRFTNQSQPFFGFPGEAEPIIEENAFPSFF